MKIPLTAERPTAPGMYLCSRGGEPLMYQIDIYRGKPCVRDKTGTWWSTALDTALWSPRLEIEVPNEC